MDSIYEIIHTKYLCLSHFSTFSTLLEKKNVVSGSSSVHASYGYCTSQSPFISKYQDITS